MNINQRAAFAAVAIEQDALAKKRGKKNKSKNKSTMKPVSRKGKNKFKY